MNGTIQVSAAQLILALVGAAGIGALTSSVITLIAQALERRARHRELLLQLSADFAKLLYEHKTSGLGFPQLSLVGQYYVVLEEVLKHGKNSAEIEEELSRVLDEFDPGRKKKGQAQ